MSLKRHFQRDEHLENRQMRFITFYGFSLSRNVREADPVAENHFSQKCENYIDGKGLHLKQVHNIDETGCISSFYSRKILSQLRQLVLGFKMNKEKIIVDLCSNAMGIHKVCFFVIRKSMKQRTFKNMTT